MLPIQFALAGMNTHIEHDLVLAVVPRARRGAPTRTTRRCWPTTWPINRCWPRRRPRSGVPSWTTSGAPSTTVSRRWHTWSAPGASRGPGTPPCSTHARCGQLRRTPALRSAYLDGLARTVGMGSRLLLTAVAGPGRPERPQGAASRTRRRISGRRRSSTSRSPRRTWWVSRRPRRSGRTAGGPGHPARPRWRARARGSRRLRPARARSSARAGTLARTVMFAKPPVRTSSTRSGTSAISDDDADALPGVLDGGDLVASAP